MFICNIDNRIDEAVAKANKIQCHNCKAMKHATEVEEQEQKRKWIEEYKTKMGIEEDKDESGDKTWPEVIKTVLTKPYVYILGCLLAISPYGVQIIDRFLNFFAN